MAEHIKLVYDPVLGRPACATLQAALGGDLVALRELFGAADDGLTVTTPDMQVIIGTREDWEHELASTERERVRS